MATTAPNPAEVPYTTDLGRTANRTDYQFRFADGDDGAPAFRVLRFDGDEAISELFRFRVRLGLPRREVQPGAEPNTEGYLGRTAYLRIQGPAGVRHVDGYVRSFEHVGQGRTLLYYQAELVPLHWQLTRRFGSRVFTEQRVRNLGLRALIDKVFTDYAGLPDDCYRKLCSDHSRGDFVAQYQETEWNFISRLMEDSGVFYFFEHDGQGPAVLTIGDDRSAYSASPLHSELRFLEPEQRGQVEEFVYELSDRRAVCTGATVVEGYDFTLGPDHDTRGERQNDRFTNLERYEFPRRLDQDGEDLAQLRLDAEQCRRWVIAMKTTAHGLVPGHTFTLTGHYDDRYNCEYLVIRVRQHGVHRQQSEHDADTTDRAEDGYSAQIWAIPADERFIPPRTAGRPRIHGTQTAIVVGSEDEEIYTDRYGRVRVQFHWDREGQFGTDCSYWIRVSQGLAGGRYGMQFLPRVGQEVIVDFLEGDPDHPIITGRVYNGDHPPPYELPDEKTKSTIKTHSCPGDDGCNELRFEDLAGEEQILLHAEKDLHVKAKGSASHSTGGTRNISTGGDHKEKVGSARHLTVEGDERVGILGEQQVVVQGHKFDHCESNHEIYTAGFHRMAAMNGVSLEAVNGGFTLKAPGGFIHIGAFGIEIQSCAGGQVVINNNLAEPSPQEFSLCSRPESPGSADSATPGFNVDYSEDGQGDAGNRATSEAASGSTDSGRSRQREIRMIDQRGQPASGERYRINRPGQAPLEGRLDENGRDFIDSDVLEDSLITFPDLDERRWRSAP